MAQASPVSPPAEGLLFPIDENGRRSSTAATTHVLAASMAAVDPSAAEALRICTNWRSDYPPHIRRMVELGIQSPANAWRMADAGLNALYGQIWFLRDGVERPLPEVMAEPRPNPFHTHTLRGTSKTAPKQLEIPYNGRILSGADLAAQIDQWEQQGIVEPSHALALRMVQAHPEWLDLSDRTVVLLGAAAEMGPLRILLNWHANLVAVDLNHPQVWQTLIELGRAGNGTLTFPLRVATADSMDDAELAAHAGADLLTETPEIAAWLGTLNGPMTVGSYAYLDGEKHVRVSLAMDAIATMLMAGRKDISLAYLLTPTDVYAMPEDAALLAQARYDEWKSARMTSNPKLWQESLHLLSGGRFFQPNVTEMVSAEDGMVYGVTDCLVVQQGPNYALAKRLQQWRAIVARRSGLRVSCNIAPATTTRSVVKNSALAAAYEGAGRFEIEIFQPETSNAVMAALLVYDLCSDESTANPGVALNNPLELFMQGANHNGLWRTGFAARSVMEIAAVLGWRAFLPHNDG